MGDAAESTPLTGPAVQIADAAIRVLVEQGFDSVSVRHVAAMAGVAPGTVQYHMGTKNELVAMTFQRSIERQEHRVAQAGESDSASRLVDMLAELLPIGPVQREDAAVWVVIGGAASTRSWLAELYVRELLRFQERVVASLEQAQAAGVLTSGVDPVQGARLVTALVNGLTLDALNVGEDQAQTLRSDLEAGLSLIIRGSSLNTERS